MEKVYKNRTKIGQRRKGENRESFVLPKSCPCCQPLITKTSPIYSKFLIEFEINYIILFREVNNRLTAWVGICAHAPSKLLCPPSKLNLPIAQTCPPSNYLVHRKNRHYDLFTHRQLRPN